MGVFKAASLFNTWDNNLAINEFQLSTKIFYIIIRSFYMSSDFDDLMGFSINGYKITEITTNAKEHKSEVLLKKGSSTKSIKSTSILFYLFTQRFERILDPFGDPHFRFHRPSARSTSEDDLKSLSLNLDFRIGNQHIEDFTILSLVPSMPMFDEPGNIEGTASFRINIQESKEFLLADLKDEIFLSDRMMGETIFRGLIQKYDVTESGDATILCHDPMIKMKQIKISVEFGAETPEAIAFMLEFNDFNHVFSERSLDRSERLFTVIVPVKGLNLKQPLNIGDVYFYASGKSIDDGCIRKSHNGHYNDEWNDDIPRAKVTVRSNSLYYASVIGHNRISQAIDLLALRPDLSFPAMYLNDTIHGIPYDYYSLYSRVRPSSWLFCRANDTDQYVLFDSERIFDNTLSFELIPNDYIFPIHELFNWLITKDVKRLTQQEKNVLQAIHWIRRSIQLGNDNDKLIDLWTALELLVSGVKTKEMFSEESLGLIKQNLSELEDVLNPDQMDIILDKINRLNDAPLMEKVSKFQRTYYLTLSAEEQKVLASSRKLRNDLIHGKREVYISEAELNKLRYIVQKLLFSKVAVMGGISMPFSNTVDKKIPRQITE